jgi:hypothetical protein
LIPEQHFFEHQFGFAVGINGPLREILGHGHAVRRSVSGAGGTENELADFVLDCGVEEFETRGDIVAKIFAGILHRFADQRVGGEVDDGLGLGFLDGAVGGGRVTEISFDEFRARIDGGTVSFAEVVQDGDFVARIDEFLNANRPDVARASRYQHIHFARV